MKVAMIIVLVTTFLQGLQIHFMEKEIEAIKSWYPFCKLLKIDLEKLRKEVDDGKID